MRRRVLKACIILFAAAALLFAAWLFREYRRPRTLASAPVIFEVEKGKSLRAIARDLKARGILQGSLLPFLAGYELFHPSQKIKAGEYAFPSPQSAHQVLETLIKGRVYLHPVTVPEGLTGPEVFEIVRPLSSEDRDHFLSAFRETGPVSAWDGKAENLEGYLFPETYHFPKGVSARDIIQAMVDQFKAVFDGGMQARGREIGMGMRDVVILASLIEKETSLPEEKRLVSAVFHNRLKLGMKLDCDPTIIYGLKLEGGYDGRLRTHDLIRDSPYNTYLHAGLPPGPICNPGRESLEAALHPAPENYLYFVSKNDGSHHFSRTLAEHQLAVRAFQKNKLRIPPKSQKPRGNIS
jgi:UPF0755 protein